MVTVPPEKRKLSKKTGSLGGFLPASFRRAVPVPVPVPVPERRFRIRVRVILRPCIYRPQHFPSAPVSVDGTLFAPYISLSPSAVCSYSKENSGG